MTDDAGKKIFGLKQDTVEKINSVFSLHSGVEKVIVYGSRAKGNYKNGSDIDLAMIGESVELAELLKIENELDDLLLPYKIDLSLMHKIESPDLLDHINRVGLIFYEPKSLH